MTNDDQVKRLLDAWFSDGPDEVPERVLDGAADRIHGLRQRPAWRLDWRPTPMASLAKPLAAIAAVVVLAVAAFTLTRPAADSAAPVGAPTPGPVASPTTSASPSESAAAFVCDDQWPGCAGRLSAGAHASSSFVIPLRYVVPDGWENSIDIGRSIKLETSTGLAGPIEVLAENVIADPASCGPVALAGAGTSVQDFIDHLRALPGLDTTEPVPVTIDGYRGQSIDMSVRADWTTICPEIDPTNPTVMLLTSTDTTIKPLRALGYTQDQLARWIVLDVAGQTVIVEVVGPPVRSQFDAALADDQPVIDSLDFTTGG